MTDLDTMQRAFRENPDDLTAAGVLADCLDENDLPARAEVTRIHCRLADPDLPLAERASLGGRAGELEPAVRREWADKLAPVFRGRYRYRFGQPVLVVPSLWRFFGHADYLAGDLGLSQLEVRHVDMLARWVDVSHLDLLTDLHVHDDLTSHELDYLAQCPATRSLREFSIQAGPDVEDAEEEMIAWWEALARVVRSPRVWGARSLHVQTEDSTHFDPFCDAIASMPDLTDLTLRGRLWDSDLESLVEDCIPERLRRLNLRDTELGSDDLVPLARSSGMGHVTWLELSGCDLAPAAARELAASPHLGSLRAFDLRGSWVDPEARRVLRERFGARVWLVE